MLRRDLTDRLSVNYFHESTKLTGLIVSTIVYFLALKLGKYLLVENDIELPPISKWVILNTFAITLAYISAIPF